MSTAQKTADNLLKYMLDNRNALEMDGREARDVMARIFCADICSRARKKLFKESQIFGEPALSTTEICKRLGFGISASFIEDELGLPPDETTSNAFYWLECRFPDICQRLAKYSNGLAGLGVVASREQQ